MSAASSADRPAPSSRGGPQSGILPIIDGPMAPLVEERLTKALGQKRAAEVISDAVRIFGSRTIATPQDLFDLASMMEKNGGLIQAVARSLKVQALLRGAIEYR